MSEILRHLFPVDAFIAGDREGKHNEDELDDAARVVLVLCEGGLVHRGHPAQDNGVKDTSIEDCQHYLDHVSPHPPRFSVLVHLVKLKNAPHIEDA